MSPTRTCGRVFAVILLISLGAAVAAQNPVPLKQDLRGTAQQPLVVKTIPSAEEVRQDEEYRADRNANLTASQRAEQRQKWNDAITDTIGIATVLILIVQAIAFYRQTREMKESVQEMKTATGVAERAAAMAKASADAAIDGNRLNREALIADQRPWIAVQSTPTLIFKRLADHRWCLDIELILQNTGKTPAHNVRVAGVLMPLAAVDELERAHLAHWSAATHISPGPTAALCFPQIDSKLKGPAQIPREFLESSSLPHVFVLSACVSYTFPQVQTRHATMFMYEIHVVNSTTDAWWSKRDQAYLHHDFFKLLALPYGWVAD